jgi:hypothetical protein
MHGGGDILARGGRTAAFPASNGVTQERWDAIWEPEVELIHPFDVGEILYQTDADPVDIIKYEGKGNDEILVINGKRYKQSVDVPAKTKRFA